MVFFSGTGWDCPFWSTENWLNYSCWKNVHSTKAMKQTEANVLGMKHVGQQETLAHLCIVSLLQGKPQGRAWQGGISCSSLAPHRMPAGCSYSMSPQWESQDLAFCLLFWSHMLLSCAPPAQSPSSCSWVVVSLGLSWQLSLLLCLSGA